MKTGFDKLMAAIAGAFRCAAAIDNRAPVRIRKLTNYEPNDEGWQQYTAR